jgi:hypothetical protein
LRILLVNVTLASRTGTETALRDLAFGLKAAGHRPAAFVDAPLPVALVGARGRELPFQRRLVEPDDNRAWTLRLGRAIQQECIVAHLASRPPAEDLHGAVDDQAADIMGRVESLDGRRDVAAPPEPSVRQQ